MLRNILASLLLIVFLTGLAAAAAATPAAGSRLSVLVLPCESDPRQADLAGLVDDLLMKALVEQQRFRVMEREKLQQLLREQQLVRERLTGTAATLRLGRLASADAILATALREEGKNLVLTCRLFTTETTATVEFTTAPTDGSLPALKALLRDVANRLAAALPVADGEVLRRDRGTLLVDLGSGAGVRKGMSVVVYRRGKELKHPTTGRSLGFDLVELGEGTIVEVRADSSVVRLSERPKAQAIVTGDRVITK